MKMIKEWARLLINVIVRVTGKTPIGRYFHNQVVKMALGQTLKISHGPLYVQPLQRQTRCADTELRVC